jgi:hypothetical protein
MKKWREMARNGAEWRGMARNEMARGDRTARDHFHD